MKRLRRALGWAGLALLALLALVLARAWAPDLEVAELTAQWATPPSQFIAVQGMQVHVRDEGPRNDPLPLVLLHGTSSSLHTWQGWADGLTASHRVLRFDLPGFGLTGPNPDGDYRISRYLSFIQAVLAAQGIQKAVLVGNSFGGNLAWAYAAQHPEQVAKLVLVDSAGYPRHAVSMPLGFKLAMTPGIKYVMPYLLPRSVIAASVRNVYGNPSLVTPALINRYYDLTRRRGNRASLEQRFVQAPPGELTGQLALIKVPTLVLWGGKDRLIPPEDAARYGHDIVGAQVKIFPELGHVPQEEDPAQTLPALLAFLQP